MASRTHRGIFTRGERTAPSDAPYLTKGTSEALSSEVNIEAYTAPIFFQPASNHTSAFQLRRADASQSVIFDSTNNTLTVPALNSTGDLEAKSTDAGAGVGPLAQLFRDSASPAANDALGELRFDGRDTNATPQRTSYATIRGLLVDPTDTSEDGAIQFLTMRAGTLAEKLRITDSQILVFDDGTGIPGLAGLADTNTGIRWVGSDTLNFFNNGAVTLAFNPTTASFSVVVQSPAGTQSAPGLAVGDSSQGLYKIAAARVGTKGTIEGQMGTSTASAPFVGTANVSTTDVGNVGAGEDNLITYSLPANALSANGKAVRIRAWGIAANNANAKTFRLYFGTTVLKTILLVANQASTWLVEAIVVRDGAASQDAVATHIEDGPTDSTGVSSTQPAMDTTAAITIKGTGEATADNDVVMRGLVVEFLN